MQVPRTTRIPSSSCRLLSQNVESSMRDLGTVMLDVLHPAGHDIIEKISAHVLIPENDGVLDPKKLETEVVHFSSRLPSFRRKTPENIIQCALAVWEVRVHWGGTHTGFDTALHIGNGFWLTNAHVVQIPSPSDRLDGELDVENCWLEVHWFPGYPHGISTLGRKKSLKAKLVAVPEKFTLRHGMVSWENDVDLANDVAMLQITDEDRAKQGIPLQCLTPAALTEVEKTMQMDVCFVGINQALSPGARRILARDQSTRIIDETVRKLKPGCISWKSGKAVIIDDHLHVTISTLGGSSGSTFVTDQGAIGLYSRGNNELRWNSERQRVEKVFNSSCRGQAIPWSAPCMKDFLRRYLPKAFEGTQNEREFLDIWWAAAELGV